MRRVTTYRAPAPSPQANGPPGPLRVSKVSVNDETGLTLATVTLHGTQDVVSLCRRARAAAREFGLDAIGTRRLCAAVVEIGEAVTVADVPPDAQLTLSDGPSMQVNIHVAGLAAL